MAENSSSSTVELEKDFDSHFEKAQISSPRNLTTDDFASKCVLVDIGDLPLPSLLNERSFSQNSVSDSDDVYEIAGEEKSEKVDVLSKLFQNAMSERKKSKNVRPAISG